jgi:hypothetical protein
MQDEDKVNRLSIPEGFPSESFEATRTILLPYLVTHPESWRLFTGAWTAMFYRYCSFLQNDNEYAHSIGVYGRTPVPEERYIQENALFCFFSAGFSMVESGCFALHAIASIINPGNFQVSQEHLRRITSIEVRKQFQKQYSSENVTDILKMMTGDEYTEFKKIRHTLTHRTAPGRHAYPDKKRVIWQLTDEELDEFTTKYWRLWLTEQVGDFTDATATFSRKYLVDSL